MRKALAISFALWSFGFVVGFSCDERILLSAGTEYRQQFGSSRLQNALAIIKVNLCGMLALVLGGFLMGSVTVIVLAANGFHVGYIIGHIGCTLYGNELILQRVVPHSFEFIGIITAGSAGLAIARYMFDALLTHRAVKKSEMFRLLFVVVASTLIIVFAGVVEGFVSIKYDN